MELSDDQMTDLLDECKTEQ